MSHATAMNREREKRVEKKKKKRQTMSTYCNEFGLQMIAGHQIGQLHVEFDANSFGSHQNGTAWCWSRNIVEIKTHFGISSWSFNLNFAKEKSKWFQRRFDQNFRFQNATESYTLSEIGWLGEKNASFSFLNAFQFRRLRIMYRHSVAHIHTHSARHQLYCNWRERNTERKAKSQRTTLN